MNLNSLDATLRSMTPSEKRYKYEHRYFDFAALPSVERDGEQIAIMEVATKKDALSSSGNLLFIKKTSRYQACPPHIHNWIEINYMYSGSCPQIINGHAYTLGQHQVALIDTDTPHSTAALGDDDIMISLIIDKKYLSSNFFNRLSMDSILSRFFINAINQNTKHDNYILFHSERSRKIPVFFNELLCELYDPSINSTDMINSLFTLVLCELLNVYENDMELQNLNMNKNSISPVLRYIEKNYRTCTLESTAAFFNMSPNYMTTLLKQRTGSSYKELLQRQRLNRAGQLLRNTQLSVTETAHAVGYENVSFFYKKFKEQFGYLPKEYRALTVDAKLNRIE
jgi:AraC-like DNA-binding protein